ncbi:MAG: DUF937 domain-containing protein [Methylophaga sp.]|nr:DUF937 domain-containing protein [Methylophaga sp.]
MDLLSMVLAATKGDALGSLAKQHNLSTDQTSDILSQLLPALTGKLQSNVEQENGLESLLGALGKGNHQRYVDEPESLSDPASLLDGNKILGHLLGSKDASRQVASQVASSTGVGSSIIKKLLPMAATMLMGAMSKGAQSNGMLDMLAGAVSGGSNRSGGGMLGSVLGSLMGGSSKSGSSDLVGSLLKGFLK